MNGSITSALRGTGCSVPDRVVPNDWFTSYVDTSDEWIRTRTGIIERRFVGPDETAATLAPSPRAERPSKPPAYPLPTST